MKTLLLVAFVVVSAHVPILAESPDDQRWQALAERYLDEMPAFSPVGATSMGDHRFDGELDEIGAESRARWIAFLEGVQSELASIERTELTRANQVDYALLAHSTRSGLWSIREVQGWAWNPLYYSGTAGGAIYSLMAREFAPLPDRLGHVADRLEKLPRYLKQVRATLVPERVPKVHAETAARQNRGVLSILENMVEPAMNVLDDAEKKRLTAAMETAAAAVEEHQTWLDETLVPQAEGDFRAGKEIYEKRLAFSLHTPLTREQLRARAEAEFDRVRREMYDVSTIIYKEQ
ncbi:MAG: DUF885 family protein, partial [Acidobacteria bacterium]|nr:DUF885 family protein [Acidobacteriota bacterium]NIQ86272.1 DUF885 family protein [Acidobacteriota bacterium]